MAILSLVTEGPPSTSAHAFAEAPREPTVGSLDMGGASSQIAFEVSRTVSTGSKWLLMTGVSRTPTYRRFKIKIILYREIFLVGWENVWVCYPRIFLSRIVCQESLLNWWQVCTYDVVHEMRVVRKNHSLGLLFKRAIFQNQDFPISTVHETGFRICKEIGLIPPKLK